VSHVIGRRGYRESFSTSPGDGLIRSRLGFVHRAIVVAIIDEEEGGPMTDRLLLSFDGPLPPTTPRRDVRHDERFDLAEAFSVTRGRTGLTRPSLVSSAHGPIRHLMLWYPGRTRRSTFEDLLAKLPAHTRVTLAAHADVVDEAEAVAAAAPREVELVAMPDYLDFTIWAEDACTVVVDASDGGPVTYMVEPFSFPRAGDQVVVDLVAQASDAVASTQLPLSFQGGNMLIGDDFVLIGRDYLDETIDLGLQEGPIEDFPLDGSPEELDAFVTDLFRRLLDPARSFHFLESDASRRPPTRWVSRREDERWIESVGGLGRRQPIFHIDMFVSLAGRASPGDPYRVLVGDPSVANAILGWDPVPHELQSEYDEVAAQLDALGFEVLRSPLPLIEAEFRYPAPETVTLEDGSTAEVVGEIEWYHPTSNNCLVQIDGDAHDVWLPTYGQEHVPALAPIDARHKEIWEGLGFTVHQLADFHHLARALGALHCIKKYLAR
jgi:hypothetical protein